MVTSGGKLNCKHVFHTSCATWNQQSGEQVHNIVDIKGHRYAVFGSSSKGKSLSLELRFSKITPGTMMYNAVNYLYFTTEVRKFKTALLPLQHPMQHPNSGGVFNILCGEGARQIKLYSRLACVQKPQKTWNPLCQQSQTTH